MIREAIERISLFEKAIKSDGTCFVDAYEFLSKNVNPKYKLVYGLVTGQGIIEGIRYNHAWIEEGNTVIDTAMKAQGASTYKFPKELYYAIGQVEDKTTFSYTHKEMIKNMLDTENYGPWAEILIKNKY